MAEYSYERRYVKDLVGHRTAADSLDCLTVGRDSGGAVPAQNTQKWFNLSVCWGLCIGIYLVSNDLTWSTGTNGQSPPGLSGANLRLTR